MICIRVSTRPELRSSSSSRSNSLSGIGTSRPLTVTTWRSESSRTGPASTVPVISSSGPSPARRKTARMRATSSRDENGLVT